MHRGKAPAITYACKLLIETNMPVSLISYESGLNTLSNFNKQFKEIMNKNPLEYKIQFSSI
ncbi:helix-turn-helix domain-containing protein [Pedobacter sp. 22163]|uniref:helix-turn-helix domain-containing protein n=1 Tax=Pedobacter sp. 22163 TaxID=3453883 RepID=UPI003F82E840